MKPHFLFFIASLLICLSSWSQERVLQVENIETGKKVYIKPQQQIIVNALDSTYMGRMMVVNDSMLKLDSDTIFVRDLNTLELDRVKEGVGYLLIGIGGFIFGVVRYTLVSLNMIITGGLDSSLMGPTALIGASSVSAIVGLVFLSKKKQIIKETHSFSIVKQPESVYYYDTQQ